MRRPARLVVTGLLALGGAAACGGSGSNATLQPQGAAAISSSTAAANGGCTAVNPLPTPSPQTFPSEPPLTIAHANYTATVVTNCGTIVATLDGKNAPHTVNSFAFLATHHFFDDTHCHRLTTSGIFVLQCGDPTGTGQGGPGYTIPDENLTGATYPAGTLAMANTGAPHSGGSQFFFCYADTSLPPAYTPFGHVVRGLDVLRAIARKGSDNSNGPGDGAPNQPVVIQSFTVVKSA